MRRANYFVGSVVCCSFLFAPNFSLGLDISWNGSGGLFGDPESWHNVDNWDPAGSPFQVQRVPAENDTAILSTPTNDTVRLFEDAAPIGGLTISHGITLTTLNHQLQVEDDGDAMTSLTGLGTELVVTGLFGEVPFTTDHLSVDSNATLTLIGGTRIDGSTSITNSGVLDRRNRSLEFGGDVYVGSSGSLLLGNLGLGIIDFAANSSITAATGGKVFARNFIQIPEPFQIENGQQWRIESGGELEVNLEAGGVLIGTSSDASLVVTGSGSQMLTTEHPNVMVPLTIGHETTGTAELQILDNGFYRTGRDVITIKPTGTVTISGGTFEAKGEVVLDGGNLTVGTNSFFDLADDKSITVRNGGVATFEETLTIEGSENYVLEDGQFNADTVDFTGVGSFHFDGGRLNVSVYNGDLTNSGGTLAPGPDANDTTIIGDYTQQAGGTLEIEVGGPGMGTGHDFVQVTGTSIVDGALEIALISSFEPDPSDTFNVFVADSLLGVFSNISSGQRLSTSDGSGSFLVNYGVSSTFDPDQIVLSDFQATAGADFDNDGDVDGTDFLLIQRMDPVLIPLWESQYGTNPLAAGVAVPEPTTFGLTAICLMIVLTRVAKD